jgi:glutamine amidotransferase
MLEPAHALVVQSYAPRRQQHGLINADGWGVGFYDPDFRDDDHDAVSPRRWRSASPPRRWRSASPLWSDPSFASVSPALRSSCVVAAVRSASAGMPIEASASAPFTDGTWLLSHNGVVDRAVLPPAPDAESVVDSAVLAALIFTRGMDALGATIVEVGGSDSAARLNIMAADGSRLLATTWGDTLSMLRRDDGVVLASEPYDDDPAWDEIPDRHLVEVVGSSVSLTPLSR